MIIRIVLAILAFLLISYAYRYYQRQTPQQKKKVLLRFAVGGLLGVLLLLIVSGRLHWLSGLVAALLVLMQRSIPLLIQLFPFAHRWWRQRASQSIGGGNVSTVQSDYLRMELDHDTGEMRGDVIHGKFAGEKLEKCGRQQLEELLAYYANEDEDSFNLLQAYLQRRFGDDFSRAEQDGNTAHQGRESSSSMTEREALEILGLEPGADKEEILSAHKKLMQKLHPDRGGSNYLAAKVNQAKDFLVNRG